MGNKIAELSSQVEKKITEDYMDDNCGIYLSVPTRPELHRTSSNLTSKSGQVSTDNTSTGTIEIESQQNFLNIQENNFKIPTNKRRKVADITISTGSSIPLNLFTIFCSLALVTCFM